MVSDIHIIVLYGGCIATAFAYFQMFIKNIVGSLIAYFKCYITFSIDTVTLKILKI